MVDLDYPNFYWIYIGYTAVTFFKGQWGQNPMSRLTYPVGKDDIETRGKLPLLACSEGTGGSYEVLQITLNMSLLSTRFINDL